MRWIITKKASLSLFGLILILLCVLYSGGISAVWNVIETCGDAIAEVGKFLLAIIMRFPDELGITDWLWTKAIFAVLSIFLFAVGYILTRQEKKRLLGIISTIVGLVSTVLTFAS